jgi:hypothetical protein
LGQATYLPRPLTNDTIFIGLPDEFGLELFNAFKGDVDVVSDQSSFSTFLKGFMINYNITDQAALGFHAADTLTMMRLFYHYFDFEEEQRSIEFAPNDVSLQFNQMELSGSKFELPAVKQDKVPAYMTDSMSFIQGGTGVFTRIEIPGLRTLLEVTENIEILHADLVMEPVKNTYTKNSLPLQLSAFITNNSNDLVTPILDDLQNIQVAALTIDDLFNEDTEYRIDITSFINSTIRQQTDNVPALLIGISPNALYRTVDNLVLGSRWHRQNKITLELYYMIYE